MSWAHLLMFAAVAANAVVLVYQVRQSRRYARELEQVIVLSELLRRLVEHSAETTGAPLWRAWSGTMGEIRVTAQARPYPPGEQQR